MTAIQDKDFDPSHLEALPHALPFFMFSKRKLLENYEKFKRLFPGSAVYYSMKANSEPDVLQLLKDAGSGFEVASIYELELLKALGVPPQSIIYGTSVKPNSHIKRFVDFGVDRFAFDSLRELEKIAGVAPRSRVCIRIAVSDAGSVFKFSEKFGTDPENVVPLLHRARDLGLKPFGISFNVGSQASNPKAWAHALEQLRPVLGELTKCGIKIDVLNLGGGYPCQYSVSGSVPSLDEIATYTLEQYDRLPYQPDLILEPGRGIVADAAVLVVTVIARVERKGNTWLFLDAGLNEVEVLIREPEDALMRRVKSIVSNVQREDVGPVEMAEALQSLLDEDERVTTQDALAKLIGKDKVWVSGMLRIVTLPVDVQEQVRTSQLAVGYDAMIRVARLDDANKQRELVGLILDGASNREIRRHIDAAKGIVRDPAATSPKPKRVYHTKYKATVIVQATGSNLTTDQCIEALGEALGQVTNNG